MPLAKFRLVAILRNPLINKRGEGSELSISLARGVEPPELSLGAWGAM